MQSVKLFMFCNLACNLCLSSSICLSFQLYNSKCSYTCKVNDNPLFASALPAKCCFRDKINLPIFFFVKYDWHVQNILFGSMFFCSRNIWHCQPTLMLCYLRLSLCISISRTYATLWSSAQAYFLSPESVKSLSYLSHAKLGPFTQTKFRPRPRVRQLKLNPGAPEQSIPPPTTEKVATCQVGICKMP